eukprot:6486291-Amphidinium_carterae.2
MELKHQASKFLDRQYCTLDWLYMALSSVDSHSHLGAEFAKRLSRSLSGNVGRQSSCTQKSTL